MLDLLPAPLRSRPPIFRGLPTKLGESFCMAASMLQLNEHEQARRWANSRPAFEAHDVPPFRPHGPEGSRVFAAFCATCESLRSGINAEAYSLIPWCIDAKGIALPVDSMGPLSHRKESRPIEPMPRGWQQQNRAIADAFAETRPRRKKEPVVVTEDIVAAVRGAPAET